MNRFNTIVCAALALGLFSQQADAALVGLWRFEGNANDSSTFGNNGTFQNGASLSGNVPGAFSTQSLFVNGGTQHVLVPDSNSLDVTGTTGITLAGWVRSTNPQVGFDGVIAKNPSNGSANNHAGNYELRIQSGSRVPNFGYQRGGVDDTSNGFNSTTALVDDVWTHVAVTAQDIGPNTAIIYYVNGVLAGSSLTQLDGFGAINTNALFIGNRADLFTVMNGFLDDVAVFNEVLSQSQIQQIQQGNFGAFGVGIPEPTAAVLGALGLASLLPRRRRAA